MERLTLEPVGIIHSEHSDHARTPIQPVCAQGCRGRVEVFPQFTDVLDGTPLLDIKPYVEKFDLREGTRGGWTEHVDDTTFRQRGERREDAE